MIKNIIVSAIVATLVAFGIAVFSECAPCEAKHNVPKESSYEHVLRTKTLRCGYVVYEPGLVKNVNDGAISGYDKDIMDVIAQRLNLKIEWIAAGGWGTVVEDIKSNKYDMLCNSYWTNAEVAKYVLYTRPLMYQPAFFIARTDDKRFDEAHPLVNDPSIKIAAIEGDSPYVLAKQKYPKATMHALSHDFDFAGIPNEVALKKADLSIVDAVTAGKFNDSNPGKIRLVMTDEPLQIVPTAFVIPSGQTQMKQVIDQALDEMILSGDLKKIYQKYNQYPHSFYYPTISYENQ